MSADAMWFGIYFGIGLIFMILALASHQVRKRAQLFDLGGAGGEVGAALLIFIALLWPTWPLWVLVKER
jgi:hypothetical protein